MVQGFAAVTCRTVEYFSATDDEEKAWESCTVFALFSGAADEFIDPSLYDIYTQV